MEPSRAARQAAWPGVASLPDTVLPVGIRQPGQVLEMKRWRDATGQQLLIVTRTPPKDDYKPGDRSLEGDILEDGDIRLYAATAWLHIRQYRRVGESWQEVWRMQDVMDKCSWDRWIGTLPNSTSITDLDKDGLTETTVVYMISCRSDVSPSALKLIMREGPRKYALRGQTVVQYDSIPVGQRAPDNPCCLDSINPRDLAAPNGYELYAGRYETEKDFASAPTSFLKFARQEWRYWRVRDDFTLQLQP
ncbi:hypothetical protein LRS06_08340 [Hymenobacter sp. J193]|nr:hypothetical protein [Hymenobacter sp. J193]MCR5887785.1 hypothetical protein [Hymenobacter sp. J193]